MRKEMMMMRRRRRRRRRRRKEVMRNKERVEALDRSFSLLHVPPQLPEPE